VYLPEKNSGTQIDAKHKLIVDQSLGTWISVHGGEIVVNHIPFVLQASKGERGTLMGHVAKANSMWQSLDQEGESVIIFQGAQGYISPSWYSSKQLHGKAVPTWNYITVHARGVAKPIEDKACILQHLCALTGERERKQENPWQLSDAPEDYLNTMVSGVVGIEIPISQLVGKWKLSQNRS
jgi:transcriptional regulator